MLILVHYARYNMIPNTKNYAQILFSQYPIKKNLMQMLRPYDLARFVAYENLYLSDIEQKRYINYIYDVVDYPFWQEVYYKNKYSIVLYGIDTKLLIERLEDPLKYEKRYGYDYILKIGISIKYNNIYNTVNIQHVLFELPYQYVLQDKFAFPAGTFYIDMGDNPPWRGCRWILSQNANESRVIVLAAWCIWIINRTSKKIFYPYPYIDVDLGLIDVYQKGYYINYINVSAFDKEVRSQFSTTDIYISEHDEFHLRMTVCDKKYHGEIHV